MTYRITIDGLEEMMRGLGAGERLLAEVWRDILRGPFGDEFLQQLKIRVGDSVRTGYTLSRVRVEDKGADGVEIGIPSSDTSRHPTSKRASAKSVGVWLESGTRMHMIPTEVRPYNRVAFNGRVVSRVAHPGTRGTRPMYRTLQVFRGDAERLLERELERRLAVRMGLT